MVNSSLVMKTLSHLKQVMSLQKVYNYTVKQRTMLVMIRGYENLPDCKDLTCYY